MKELKQCCLRHVAGGAIAFTPKYTKSSVKGMICCDACYAAGFDDAMPETSSFISRDKFSGYISDVGGILTALGAGYSGVGVLAGTAISFGATKGFTMLGEHIYDNPEAARHPDYPDYSDYKYP